MSTEDNKALVRRYYEEVLAKRNTALVDELFASNYVYHYSSAPPNLPAGLEGFKRFVTIYLSGFSNLRFTIEDQIAEGDKVATRLSAHAANLGAMRSSPAVSEAETASQPAVSGTVAEPISFSGISIERIVDGKIVESWGEFDLLGAQRQLGATLPTGEVRQ